MLVAYVVVNMYTCGCITGSCVPGVEKGNMQSVCSSIETQLRPLDTWSVHSLIQRLSSSEERFWSRSVIQEEQQPAGQ